MRFTVSIISIVLLLVFINCNSNKSNINQADINSIQNQLIEAHKGLLKNDADSIKNYIKSKGWNMSQTQTGLWIEIYEKGYGAQIENNDIVELSYSLELLDGTLCYKSDSINSKIFKVGQGGVESGLEEAILQMHGGDKARLILPPHLAHGVVGDFNKIPRMAILKYDIEVLTVKKHKELSY